MTAIVIRDDAKATWPTGLAGVRVRARDMVQRAMACAAATIMVCAVGVALLQLVAQILSFPAAPAFAWRRERRCRAARGYSDSRGRMRESAGSAGWRAYRWWHAPIGSCWPDHGEQRMVHGGPGREFVL